MNDYEFNKWKAGYIYKPTENWEPKVLNATVGFKFSNDIFISKDKCDQWNIPYKEEELEDTCIGKALRLKRPPKKDKGDVDE